MVVQIIRTTGREMKQAEREGESLQGNVTGRGEESVVFLLGRGEGRKRETEREKRRGKRLGLFYFCYAKRDVETCPAKLHNPKLKAGIFNENYYLIFLPIITYMYM